MIHRIQCSTTLEVDTETGTLHVVFETPAAEGDGDVTVWRVDVTGELDGDARHRLRHAFTPAT